MSEQALESALRALFDTEGMEPPPMSLHDRVMGIPDTGVTAGRRWSPVGTQWLASGQVRLAFLAAAMAGLLVAIWASVGQAPSPPNAFALWSIAFTRDGDLFVAGADGSDPVKVATGDLGNGEWIDRFAFAPDRRSIAITRATGGEPGAETLSVISPDGRTIGSYTGGVQPYGLDFSWAPDGQRLAVHSDAAPGEVVYIGLDGQWAGSVSLPDGAGLHHGVRVFPMLPWSPDGRWIAVSANGPAQPSCSAGQMGTCYLLVSTSGAEARWMPTNSNWLAWAPDSRVAVGHWLGGVDISAADGSGLTTVTLPDGFTPADGGRSLAWSPDGTRLAVIGTSVRAGTGAPAHSLVVIEPDGTARLVPTGPFDVIQDVAWSADGQSLEFAAGNFPADAPLAASIWSVDAAGGNPVVLVTGPDRFVVADGTP